MNQAAAHAASRRRVPPGSAARRYPDTLLGQAQALQEELTTLGHEMRWGFKGGETASAFTGTCDRCGGQVTGRRACPIGGVTVTYPGRALLAAGPAQVLRPCGSRQ